MLKLHEYDFWISRELSGRRDWTYDSDNNVRGIIYSFVSDPCLAIIAKYLDMPQFVPKLGQVTSFERISRMLDETPPLKFLAAWKHMVGMVNTDPALRRMNGPPDPAEHGGFTEFGGARTTDAGRTALTELPKIWWCWDISRKPTKDRG